MDRSPSRFHKRFEMRFHVSVLSVVAFGLLLMLPGCENPAQEPPTTPTVGDDTVDVPEPMTDESVGDDAAGDNADAAAADPSTAENFEAAFASLTEQQRQAVREQATCPVSGEPLGSMGTPKPVEVKDRTVWICCNACRDKLKANPDKYLAKLPDNGQA
jgi:Cu(I)/Ag(I) efflux system membrane fusion protein